MKEVQVADTPATITRELANTNPLAPSEVDGSLHCFFCESFDPEPHRQDCLWSRAVAVAQTPDSRVAAKETK